MEEWSLQAVVRGSGDETEIARAIDGTYFGSLDTCKEYDQALLFSFPDLFETTTVIGNELEELYKPFYPMYNTLSPPQTISSSTTSMEAQAHPLPIAVKQEIEEKKIFFGSPSVSTPSTSHATKPKKRKNQQKRVVLQVSAEGLSSDLWAWRKYGQKPIKGSPYPRSYYRCSSSKGCLARRQVEQSCTDTGIYIVTYTAEHNHPQPTRRNSLAGVNRHNFRSARKSPTISDGRHTAKSKDNSQAPSPTTSPSFSSVDEEVLQQKPIIKQERRYSEDYDHEVMMARESDENDFVMPDMIFSDDFFVGLEDLDGLNSDLSFYNCSNKQYPVSFCS